LAISLVTAILRGIVAAEDEIERAGRRIFLQIEVSELHGTDDVLPQPESTFFLPEILSHDRPGNLAETAFRIESFPGPLKTGVVDVRRKDGKDGGFARESLPQNAEGIGLLPGSAPRAPGSGRFPFRRKGR
jgi:hypothetical protein